MPTSYEIDTRFLKILTDISMIFVVFSITFILLLLLTGIQNRFLQSMYVLFLIFLVLFLAMSAFFFIKWFSKYKPSLFKIFK